MKVALLDLYKGTANVGLNSIKEILSNYPELEVTCYDVRLKRELPGMDYDLYISSGGPGSPLEGDGIWERGYFYLMDKLWIHNQRYTDKKYAFFICHSFQMICHFLSLGSIIHRKAQSLGVFPVHKTKDGKNSDLLASLDDRFYVGDSRKWQFIEPFKERVQQLGCKILAIEKSRPHVSHEQAIMAIQFSDEWVGTQFHPEAKSSKMLEAFTKDPIKSKIIKERGLKRYEKVIASLEKFGDKMDKTYAQLIPGYIEKVIRLKNLEQKTINH